MEAFQGEVQSQALEIVIVCVCANRKPDRPRARQTRKKLLRRCGETPSVHFELANQTTALIHQFSAGRLLRLSFHELISTRTHNTTHHTGKEVPESYCMCAVFQGASEVVKTRSVSSSCFVLRVIDHFTKVLGLVAEASCPPQPMGPPKLCYALRLAAQ